MLTGWLNMDEPFLPVAGVYPPGHTGFDLGLRMKHMILPVTVVAIEIIAVYSRYMRASLLEVEEADYIRTARAKGISEQKVVVHGGIRNTMIPISLWPPSISGRSSVASLSPSASSSSEGQATTCSRPWATATFPRSFR